MNADELQWSDSASSPSLLPLSRCKFTRAKMMKDARKSIAVPDIRAAGNGQNAATF
jgi:hypothetical protein